MARFSCELECKKRPSKSFVTPLCVSCSTIALGLCLMNTSVCLQYAYAEPENMHVVQHKNVARAKVDHLQTFQDKASQKSDTLQKELKSDKSDKNVKRKQYRLTSQDAITSYQDRSSVSDGTNSVSSLPSSYSVPFNLHYKTFPSDMTYFKRWESGNNYDHGFSSGDGYNALGAYQFDRRYGLDTFMKQVYNYDPDRFSMLARVGEKYGWDFETPKVYDWDSGDFSQFGKDMNEAWHNAYATAPDTFSRLQDYYTYYNYYAGPDGVKKSLLYFGINLDERSNNLKSLVWGMANLFGKGGGISYLKSGQFLGCNRFFQLAEINDSMSDSQIIEAVCDAIINNVENVLPNSGAYWQGYINRYTDEKAHYLGRSVGAWKRDINGWRYVNALGENVRGWFKASNGKWWYSDPTDGYAVMGDCVVNGYHYWIDGDKGLLYNSWIQNKDGSWMHTDKWGILVKGWYQTSNGKWWYFNKNDYKSVMGDCVVNGYHYWIDGDNGLLYNSWIQNKDGSWMHTDKWGILEA